MTINDPRFQTLLISATIIFVPGALFAEPTKNLHTILKVSANNIQIDQTTNSMNYAGKVRLSHGSLTMTGSRAIATSKSANSRRVTLSGAPARAQFTDRSGQPTQLTSNQIHYNSLSRIVSAQGGVKLLTKDGVISAQNIEYNLATDYFRVTGDEKSPRISARLKIGDKKLGAEH